jgi:hypothetical protein
MAKDFLPRGDGQLVQWARNFSYLINLAPEDYQLTEEQAADFALLYEQFSEDYARAIDPSTRTASAVQRKNTSRARLKKSARVLARHIQSRIETSDAQRANLRLSIRGPGSPIPKPAETPLLEIIAVDGYRLVGQLRMRNSGRSGKDVGIQCALVYTFVGDEPSNNLRDWKMSLYTSRNRFTLNFPTHLAPGTRVWICAQWGNPRAMFGPACSGISVLVGGGLPSVSGMPGLRRAA